MHTTFDQILASQCSFTRQQWKRWYRWRRSHKWKVVYDKQDNRFVLQAK